MAPSSLASPAPPAPAWSQVGGGRLSYALRACRPPRSPHMGQRAPAKDRDLEPRACWRGLEGTKLNVPSVCVPGRH